jgi:hypothetical protein
MRIKREIVYDDEPLDPVIMHQICQCDEFIEAIIRTDEYAQGVLARIAREKEERANAEQHV